MCTPITGEGSGGLSLFSMETRRFEVVRHLVIGDIHGCYDELEELLVKADLDAEDRIISVGDMVDRGPRSVEVFAFFSTNPRARSVQGNHERKHVRSARNELRPALSQKITRRQFGNEDYSRACIHFESLPNYIELPEALIVHGFYEPGVPLEAQRENVLVGTMGGKAYLEDRFEKPWYALYDGPKPIIVGHQDYGDGEPLIVRNRVYGIDTGCCHGKRLTGILLPDFEVISVESRKDYWSELKNQARYADFRYESVLNDYEALSWDAIEKVLQGIAGSERPDLEDHKVKLGELNQRSTQAVEAVYAAVTEAYSVALSRLQSDPPCCEWSSRDQAKRFAQVIGNTPFAPLAFSHAKNGVVQRRPSRRI